MAPGRVDRGVSLFLFIFSNYAGMAIWLIALYFTIYYLLALGITRVRAEVGPPTHEMFSAKPAAIYSRFARFTSDSTTEFNGVCRCFSRSIAAIAHIRCHIRWKAFKLVEVADMRARRMVVALMCGVFFGILASFWAYLTVSYKTGANQVGGKKAVIACSDRGSITRQKQISPR